MKLSKKVICCMLIVVIFVFSFNTYALTASINIVKYKGTPIEFNGGKLTKEITNLENDEIDIKLNISIDDQKVINSNSEILFLLDNSASMSTLLEDNNTIRKTKIVNSARELINKINNNNPNVKMGMMYFSSSTNVLQEFTNEKTALINACNTFMQKGVDGDTKMANALNVAKKKFTSSVKNKILILLTDGLPTDGDSATKAELQDKNVYIISCLVGLNNLNSVYQSKVENIFGTASNPIADRFYNIADNQIETVISNDIYGRILEDFKSQVSDIEIKDYFPDDIVNNFNITIEDKTKGSTNKTGNKITWSIDDLDSLENVSLMYKLKLKNDYNTNIIDKIVNTNQSVELNYVNMMGNKENKNMIDSPQIKIEENNTIPKSGSNLEGSITNPEADTSSDEDGTALEPSTRLEEDDKELEPSTISEEGSISPELSTSSEENNTTPESNTIPKENNRNFDNDKVSKIEKNKKTIKADISKESSNEDLTMANKKIPYAGNSKAILVGIVFVIIHIVIVKKKMKDIY